MGRFTDHTDTELQTLKPREACRLQRLLNQLPPALNRYRVTRKVLLPKGSLDEFEVRHFVILAPNGADACRLADESKFQVEWQRGHHKAARR